MKRQILFLLAVFCLMWIQVLPVKADSTEEALITISPDGEAFTTNAGERTTCWYKEGYEVLTGIKGTLRNPGIGEHLYTVIRKDSIPVKKWKVVLTGAKCQHSAYPSGNVYHGVLFNRKSCLGHYYSGWFPYCADCGEVFDNNFFYMSDRVAKSIGYLDMSKSYYYKCPHCDNLEQGIALVSHRCKDISMNKYYVRYQANFGKGYMEKSVHMVDNATVYEGRTVTPQTTLNLNTYTRVGYEFVGWNTKKDGSGTAFSDGEEIYNLSLTENDNVVLYAQWRKRKSVLEIDPGKGEYDGKKENLRITGDYLSEYRADSTLLTPPEGFRVEFDTSGGERIEAIYSNQKFTGWNCSQPFNGELKDNIYTFTGADGTVDRITAIYEPQSIQLPPAEKEGYSFGGWFLDKEQQEPVGTTGDTWIPQKDTTLYASWVELQLMSKDNYNAYQGTGAVDLSWQQKDNKSKIYQVYQKCEGGEWKNLDSVEEVTETTESTKTIFYSGTQGYYTVPYTGFYSLQLSGAQGENFASYKGGKGGRVTATLYLEKGEKLNYEIGGQNGYSKGGKGEIYGNGGGYSLISSERTGIILVAGGGGGASSCADGGDGGLQEHLSNDAAGADGECGGGGGYPGGIAGSVLTHVHSSDCGHLHIGSPDVYGGCYTISTRCNSRDIKFEETGKTFYYGNIADDGSHIYCVRCASHECPGHLDRYGVYTCQKCFNQVKYPITQCSAMSGYKLSCERDEEYICGFSDGDILQVRASSGGANYINTDVCMDYKTEVGVNEGDGNLCITIKRTGFLPVREWKAVKATDRSAPNVIEKDTIRKTAVGEDTVRISFQTPKDNGTDYYHMVESYNLQTMEFMCRSNIAKNTLVSQVSGFRYVLDSHKNTQPGAEHEFLKADGQQPFLTVKADTEEKILHIAAQDRAGNIGPAVHISISMQDVVYWPLITEKLEIQEGENIVPTDTADTYYVRADGNTPIQLLLQGELCGSARKQYQIDEATYLIQPVFAESAGEYTVLIPKKENVSEGIYTYAPHAIRKQITGETALSDASYTQVQRYNLCRNIAVKQQFVLPAVMDGVHIRVTPGVAATGENEKNYSDRGRDITNSIFLIGDGRAPDILGAEELKKLEMVDITEEETIRLKLEARDMGSGLERFYIEVRNHDNGHIQYYEDSALTGCINLTVEKENPLFAGGFQILVYARDKVGNESTICNQSVGVALDAYVTRVLEPHTPVFKKGESGILNITAYGYVNRLEITFPEAIGQMQESEKRTIEYEIPGYMKQEKIPFMIPLISPEGEHTIQIKAYKDNMQLDTAPKLITINVSGSVLNEFRTRLR